MSKCEGATDDVPEYLCPICKYQLVDIFTDPKTKFTTEIPFPAEVKICPKCGNVQMFSCRYLKERRDTGVVAPNMDVDKLR